MKLTTKPEIPLTADPQRTRRFRRCLLSWYDRHKRDLPWRQNRDPYRVWLSEIMLQQTRVNAVIDHYQSFLRRFPTVEALATARESSVLAAWSGLGYYRRARMLHAAAKKVVKEHDGNLPCSAQELRMLPGIGRYTSAAIASIAFGESAAVVDGNVQRVLERVLGGPLSGEKLWEEAETLLDRQKPGDYNQAIMELGATVCTPRAPACTSCPVTGLCITRGEAPGNGKTNRQYKRDIAYTLACRNGSVFLVQRPMNVSLMPGMWELPEGHTNPDTNGTFLTLRHSITVTDYTVQVKRGPVPRNIQGKWVANTRLRAMPLTGVARKILRAAKVM